MSSPAVQLHHRSPRVPDAAVAKARLSVVPRPRTRAARMPFLTVVSLILLGGIVGLLCFNTQMQKASFAATGLQAQADTLTAREQTLHDDLQALRDPQHLATLAQAAGMVAPLSACTIALAAATTDATCTPALAGDAPQLLARPPRRPDVLDPKPYVVTVTAPVTTQRQHRGTQHRGRNRDTAAR